MVDAAVKLIGCAELAALEQHVFVASRIIADYTILSKFVDMYLRLRGRGF